MNPIPEHDDCLSPLRGRRIAVVGFGSQGRAQAMNLRDSGLDVVVALREGSQSRAAVADAGLPACTLPEAAGSADMLMMLIPDEQQPGAYAAELEPHLRTGAYLGFAHGFSIHYGRVRPGADVNVFLVAPKGVGPMVRKSYLEGLGVACLIGVHQDPTGDTRQVARACAAGISHPGAAVFETTFREETETDLFGEQAVLCGGMVELIRSGYETLVSAGYAPELAYFECLHEVKLIADLIHERGLAGMRRSISRTAAFGGLTRGPRVVGPAARAAMQQLLAEIRSGEFAREWMTEAAGGAPRMRAALDAESHGDLERVGERVRALVFRPPPAAKEGDR